MTTVYLNGEFLPRDQAKVSVLDRGFLFADSIYEVIPVHHGKYFLGEEHLQRLDRSLLAIDLNCGLSHSEWFTIFDKLMAQYDDKTQAYSIYLQVTRGVDVERNHAFPITAIQPTVFVQITPATTMPIDKIKRGLSVIVADDTRWVRNSIKSTSLLPSIIQRDLATQQKADEAILVREGYVSEATASNVYMVKDGVILTHPEDGRILGGITRGLTVELANKFNMPLEERAILREELYDADEIWLSSAAKDVAPVVTIDGEMVADGKPGPVWQQMWQHFQDYKANL
tara:strand:- start:76611 stop:77465 length:855 start_codon:yes stop_codon:yes gene_type:complete